MAQLTITPNAGDLGTIVSDIQYTITSDTAGTLTASIVVNGAPFTQQSLSSGVPSTISVMQLPTGSGTIVLNASLVESGGTTTTQSITWTYTKTPINFTNSGSVGSLSVNGQTVLPTTLAEAVRTSPVWGGSLDLALQSLCQAALYKTVASTTGLYDISDNLILKLPGAQIETGSYTGTGTYGQSNPNTLTFGFVPKIVFISGNSSSSLRLYQGNINVVNKFGNAFSIPYSSSSNVYAYGWHVSVANNQVSWYTEFRSSEYQMNDSNSTYYYIAIS